MKKGPVQRERLAEVAAMNSKRPKHSLRYSKKRNARLTEEGASQRYTQETRHHLSELFPKKGEPL